MIFIILYWWFQYLWGCEASKDVFAFLSTFELGAEIVFGGALFGVWWGDRHG